jgi:hypothetical protein
MNASYCWWDPRVEAWDAPFNNNAMPQMPKVKNRDLLPS